MDIYQEALEFHEQLKGKLEILSRCKITDKKSLSLAYTPGVAEPCRVIAKDTEKVYKYTGKGNIIAIVTDGSAVLGLGNIGAEASLPVMEGKSVLFKEFANINCVPICLKTQDPDELILIIKNLAPAFGGILLEDISAPRCFAIEDALQDIGIPVFHDDQHGTAIVVLAALKNAAKVVGKQISELKIVIFGAGAAALAIARLLLCLDLDKEISKPVKEIILCDTKGPIHMARKDLNAAKAFFAEHTNYQHVKTTEEAVQNADVLIGVSGPGAITEKMVCSMNSRSIVFALANPVPEIMPDVAKAAGAMVIGTGRSDFPNQINNVLAFPGLFRGLLDSRATRVTANMKLKTADALAACVENPTAEQILPSPLDKSIAPKIARAVMEEVEKENTRLKQVKGG